MELPILRWGESFQFLGIPPKGELADPSTWAGTDSVSFQFLGIPPKGERRKQGSAIPFWGSVGFEFLGIPPKGERVK